MQDYIREDLLRGEQPAVGPSRQHASRRDRTRRGHPVRRSGSPNVILSSVPSASAVKAPFYGRRFGGGQRGKAPSFHPSGVG